MERRQSRRSTLFLPHQVASEQKRDRLKAAVGECVRLANSLLHRIHTLQTKVRNVKRAKERLSDMASLRLPRIGLAEAAAIADEHEQRDAIEKCERDNAVDGGKESVVLHEHGGTCAREVRAGRDADAFFFFGQAHE